MIKAMSMLHPAAQAARFGQQTHRVLYVEDEPALSENFLEWTADINSERAAAGQDTVEFVHVASGDDALKAIQEQQFDALVTDERIPGPSGIEVIRAFREKFKNAYITLYSATPSVKAAIIAGANEIMTKPATDFYRFMENLFNRIIHPPVPAS